MLRNKQYFFKSELLNSSFLVFFFIFFGLTFNNLQAQQKTFIIVLDAGHGGRDPGNLGTGRYKKYEKDIALDITLKVGRLLKHSPEAIKVIYTRTTDVYPDLWKRAEVANKANADLFVSIHCNSFGHTAHGTETYVLGINRNKTNLDVAKRENDVILLEKDHEKHYQYDPNSPESIIGLTLMQEDYLDKSIDLAQTIENSFVKNAGRFSRGVKQAGLIVLHQTYMPSVLVEVGFLTNRKEEDFLNSKSGQFKISRAIVLAIEKYVTHTEQNEVAINADVPVKKADIKKDSKKEPKVVINAKKNTKKDYVKKPISVKKTTKKPIIKADIKAESQIVFKVQIASSSNKLATKSYNFKGAMGVERAKIDGLYKYYLGKSLNYATIKILKSKAKKIGFKSAFIVAFKNGKRIDLQKALKTN